VDKNKYKVEIETANDIEKIKKVTLYRVSVKDKKIN
jgi:predicted thioesterase